MTRTLAIRSVTVAVVIVTLTVLEGTPRAEGASFIRGDVDGSPGFSITDGTAILRYLFFGEPWRISCQDAADVDDDDRVSVSDAIYLLSWLYFAGPVPPPPFEACGPDPTDDELDCEKTTCGAVDAATHGADTVVFVVESSARSVGDSRVFMAKREVMKAIESLPSSVRVAVHLYSHGVASFPSSGETIPATEDVRRDMSAFVRAMPPGDRSCPYTALIAALDSVGPTPTGETVVILVGTGAGDCSENDERRYLVDVLHAVTRENAGRARVHTVAVQPTDPWVIGYLEEFAARNGGTYGYIPR